DDHGETPRCSSESDADRINPPVAAVLDRLLPALTAGRPAPGASAQELREEIDKFRRQLDAAEKQFAQRRAVFDSLLTAVQDSPGWKLTAPLRALWQWWKVPGFSADALIPWHNLEPAPEAGPGAWKAAGDDAQFLTPCLLPAGWLRVRLRLRRRDDERPTREQAELYADFGTGIR